MRTVPGATCVFLELQNCLPEKTINTSSFSRWYTERISLESGDGPKTRTTSILLERSGRIPRHSFALQAVTIINIAAPEQSSCLVFLISSLRGDILLP